MKSIICLLILGILVFAKNCKVEAVGSDDGGDDDETGEAEQRHRDDEEEEGEEMGEEAYGNVQSLQQGVTNLAIAQGDGEKEPEPGEDGAQSDVTDWDTDEAAERDEFMQNDLSSGEGLKCDDVSYSISGSGSKRKFED